MIIHVCVYISLSLYIYIYTYHHVQYYTMSSPLAGGVLISASTASTLAVAIISNSYCYTNSYY